MYIYSPVHHPIFKIIKVFVFVHTGMYRDTTSTSNIFSILYQKNSVKEGKY